MHGRLFPQRFRFVIVRASMCFALSSLVPAIQAETGTVELTGRVVDSHGVPVAGASVTLLPEISRYEEESIFFGTESAPVPLATDSTNEEGEYLLRGQPGAGSVRISADGKLPQVFQVFPALESKRLPRAVLPSASLERIEVVDGEGKPISGARVRAFEEGTERFWSPHSLWVDTDALGKAQLSVGRRIGVVVEAQVPRMNSSGALIGWSRVRQSLRDGSRIAFSAGDVRLRLRFLRQGKPLQGCIFREENGLWLADGKGEVELPVVSKVVWIAGTILTPDSNQEWAWTGNLVGDSAEEVLLPSATIVRGRILGVDGRGLEGAYLGSVNNKDGPWALTTSGGRFEFPLYRDRGFDAMAMGRNTKSTGVTREAASEEITIELERAGIVELQMESAPGKPLRDVRAETYKTSTTNWNFLDSPRSRERAPTVSGPDGRLMLDDLEAGTEYFVWLDHPDFEPRSLRLTAPGPGERKTGGTIELERGGAGLRPFDGLRRRACVPLCSATRAEKRRDAQRTPARRSLQRSCVQ